MVVGPETARHGDAGSIQQPQKFNVCVCNSAAESTKKDEQRSREMSRFMGQVHTMENPAYLSEVEIWGLRPAAITSRLSIA